jgi:hypothetical protein
VRRRERKIGSLVAHPARYFILGQSTTLAGESLCLGKWGRCRETAREGGKSTVAEAARQGAGAWRSGALQGIGSEPTRGLQRRSALPREDRPAF